MHATKPPIVPVPIILAQARKFLPCDKQLVIIIKYVINEKRQIAERIAQEFNRFIMHCVDTGLQSECFNLGEPFWLILPISEVCFQWFDSNSTTVVTHIKMEGTVSADK